MYPTLTKKQKEILDFIKIYSQMHGYAPSLEEIKEHFRLSAISTVHEHIQNLKSKGFIQKEINQARSIRPVESELRNNEFTEVPVTSTLTQDSKLKLLKKVEIMLLHKNLLKQMGHYFAVLIDTDRLTLNFLAKGDLLIVKEQNTVDDNDVCLYTLDDKKYELCRIAKDKNGYLVKPLYSVENARSYKKLTVAGIVVCVIRKFPLAQ
ncbi:MAG TPA: S24 family peptidase [Candidatus Dojkabacteria bacterium]|nr:S24 family peptidase [Candidatus Dojkabacteria bacterium]